MEVLSKTIPDRGFDIPWIIVSAVYFLVESLMVPEVLFSVFPLHCIIVPEINSKTMANRKICIMMIYHKNRVKPIVNTLLVAIWSIFDESFL